MGRRIIKSVLRATKILNYIGEHGNEVRLTEISKGLDINKSTLHSIMSTLESAEYISQNENNSKYSLGNQIFKLGKIYEGDMSFTKIARPFLKKLNTAFEETVQLGVLSGKEVLYIDKVESSHALRMTCQTGAKDDLHASATGKVLLAHLNAEQQNQILAARLEKHTKNTLVVEEKLRDEIKQISEQGYAFDHQESEIGLNCVAAPVKDHTNNVIATIGVSAPISRVSEEELLAMKDKLLKVTKELSTVLGAS